MTTKISLKILVSYVVLTTLVLQEINAACFTGERYKILILNDFPNNNSPMIMHCVRGGKDLGIRTLNKDIIFQIKACKNIFFRTVYNCFFLRGPLHLSYNVFDDKHQEDCSGHVCFWVLKTNGLFFREPSGTLGKVMDWQKE